MNALHGVARAGVSLAKTGWPMIALLAGPQSGLGASMAYDFTGTGEVCTQLVEGENATCSQEAFTGIVTIDVLAEGPGGSDGETDGSTIAFDDTGWTQSHFVIRWDDITLQIDPFPGWQWSLFPTAVENNRVNRADDVFHDMLYVAAIHASESSEAGCWREAHFTRWSTDTSWLNDVSFDLSVGLAPGSDAVNRIDFASGAFGCTQVPTDGFAHKHLSGDIALTSLTPHVSVVGIGIDIRPGGAGNRINPRAAAIIPVAVLGSGDFDATQVDASTVAFGPGAAAPLRDARVRDVNRDGFVDQVFRFKARELALTCGDTRASLSARTFDGVAIEGTDSVEVLGCNR